MNRSNKCSRISDKTLQVKKNKRIKVNGFLIKRAVAVVQVTLVQVVAVVMMRIARNLSERDVDTIRTMSHNLNQVKVMANRLILLQRRLNLKLIQMEISVYQSQMMRSKLLKELGFKRHLSLRNPIVSTKRGKINS